MKLIYITAALLCAIPLASASAQKTHRARVSQLAPVSYGTPETDPVVEPQTLNATQVQHLIFEYTNQERQRHGLPPFRSNEYLAAAAYGHSSDMANRGYFGHNSKGFINRSNPTTRVAATGFRPQGVAENIAKLPTFRKQWFQTVQTQSGPRTSVSIDGNTYSQIAASAVKMWMDSPGHRQNILNPRNTQLGVGVALGYEKSVPYLFLTQNFCSDQ